MTQKKLVELIAMDVNSQSRLVTASVSRDGSLVLTAKKTGPHTGLKSARILDGDRELSSGSFSRGENAKKVIVIGNQGDTYFQRWDGVKTLPAGSDDENQVVDIASVMLETHINIDGRTDIDRGSTKLASIDWSSFGKLNTVYSQQNNFFSSVDYDEALNLDTYPSSIVWSLTKNAGAEIDEWTHITATSTLPLDGDKGPVTALRRFQNSILAFQPKGISEILFNSRTQLSTQDGVPVEIGNSGKVDGKRYITGKYGATNKWSIAEGKSALYFVDNMNKAFCSFTGGGVDNLSEKYGFGAWFRSRNNVEPWTPESFGNIVSFYDRVNSDVYLVRADSDGDAPCLAYSETLGAFSSFFDYGSVPMMANVGDRFVSYRNNRLWFQNDGFYCNFFGRNYGYHTIYRVTPDPYGDKIWTNVEYRADEYTVLDDEGSSVVPDNRLIDGGDLGGVDGIYRKDGTFDRIRIWNEYQQTDNVARSAVRKFRTWRFAIPRAVVTDTNRFGLDRIRNPWVNLELGMTAGDKPGKELMQLHDITVKYFE